MPHWGYALLIAYVAIGLNRKSQKRAGQLAVAATAVVIGYAMVSYGGI